MIFNIRGDSGSGKSFIVNSILNANDNIPILESTVFEPREKIIGHYIPSLLTNIIGRYNNISGGGCDGISTQNEVCEKVCKFKNPNLIFEGKLVSHSFMRYHLLTKKSGPIIFCFLDTSLEKCIERVYQRRKLKGIIDKFNEEYLRQHYAKILRSKQKFANSGHLVYELDSENSVEDFMEIFNKYKGI